MYEFAGRTVLVTGASTGIGEAFARELARLGANLVLVARGEERLRTLSKELATAHGVKAEVLVEDLTKAGAARRIADAVHAKGLVVDVLINNAGFGMHGPFEDVAVEVQRQQVDLNVGALVELTHAFLPDVERRQGGIIQVASTAAFQPMPYMAVYGATKAFVLSFSEALWAEYRNRGVRVLALCPGPTESAFFARAGEASAVGPKVPAVDVVRDGLAAFAANRSFVVQGTRNYLVSLVSRWTPRQVTARLSERVMRPKDSNAPGTRTSEGGRGEPHARA
jgi:short-subunit dehydrogenase